MTPSELGAHLSEMELEHTHPREQKAFRSRRIEPADEERAPQYAVPPEAALSVRGMCSSALVHAVNVPVYLTACVYDRTHHRATASHSDGTAAVMLPRDSGHNKPCQCDMCIKSHAEVFFVLL